jgi:hypothetical protein
VRIRGSVTCSCGAGSCTFVRDLQYAIKNIVFLRFFFFLLVKGTLTSFSKDKKSKRSHKAVDIKVFLTTLVLLLGDRRIRIRTSNLRIREAPKTYEFYGSGTMPTGMQKRQMGYIQYAPEKVLDVLPLGLPGQVADKNPVVHWLPLQHRTAGMRSENVPGSAPMGKRLIPVSDLEFSVFGDPEGFIPDPRFQFIPDPCDILVRCPLVPYPL